MQGLRICHTSYVIVGNVMNTSSRPRCAHGSWDAHYYALSGSSRDVCAILGCSNYVEVGAHVRAINIGTSEEIVLPTCTRCNRQSGYMQVKLGVQLIPANTQRTGCYRRLVA